MVLGDTGWGMRKVFWGIPRLQFCTASGSISECDSKNPGAWSLRDKGSQKRILEGGFPGGAQIVEASNESRDGRPLACPRSSFQLQQGHQDQGTHKGGDATTLFSHELLEGQACRLRLVK